MKVSKFHAEDPGEKVTLRIRLESKREAEMLTCVFTNTYMLQELINKNLTEGDRFTHEEVKASADEIYRALVMNK